MAATYKKGGLNIKNEYTLNFMSYSHLTKQEQHFYKYWRSQYELELKMATQNNNKLGIQNANRLLNQLEINFSK